MYGNEKLKEIIGRRVTKVRMNEDYLVFETDKGNLTFTVYGDCCSSSFFYDFYGVRKLLENGVVKEVKEVPLTVEEYTVKPSQDIIQAYGYQITTHNETWGDMTSVFSFRNDSNGYYGGSLEYAGETVPNGVPEITDDTLL